jgi:putative aldouronate transport system permease protein
MAFIYLIIIIVLLIIVYPLYFVTIASFSDPGAVANGEAILFPKNLNFEGYKYIFEYKLIWQGYKNTIIYTTVGVIINLVVLMPCAYALSRKDLVFRGPFMMFFVITMYFTGGIVTKFVLISKLGIMDSMWALILPRAVNVFNLIIARTFFMSTVPDELLDSSRIDGATNTQFFIQCVLPLSKAIIAIMLLRHAIFYWNDYFDGYMFIYTTSKNTLQLTLQQILIANQVIDMESMEQLDAAMDRAALAALIKYCIIFVSAAPMLILYPFLQKYFVQGMLIGAVKG